MTANFKGQDHILCLLELPLSLAECGHQSTFYKADFTLLSHTSHFSLGISFYRKPRMSNIPGMRKMGELSQPLKILGWLLTPPWLPAYWQYDLTGFTFHRLLLLHMLPAHRQPTNPSSYTIYFRISEIEPTRFSTLHLLFSLEIGLLGESV